MAARFLSWAFGNPQIPPAMAQRTLWCAFSDDLQVPFGIQCAVNTDTVDDVKQKIWTKNQQELAHVSYRRLEIYSPSDVINDTLAKDSLDLLRPRQVITADFPKSKDSEVDLVIIRPREQHELNTLASRRLNTLWTKPDDQNECARSVTVEALWGRLQEVAVVHVRGTPASGKSTLARLLQDHVQQVRPDLPIYHCTWYPQFVPRTPRYEEALKSLLGEDANASYWGKGSLLLIIDEAHLSFPFTPLWNDLIKATVPGRGPLIALFSAYGSPSDWLWETRTPTPITLSPYQKVSLRPSAENPNLCLFFSRPEFDDTIHRLCVYYSRGGLKFELQCDVQDYIWKLTCGQPAAVRSIVDGLSSSEVSITLPGLNSCVRLTKHYQIFRPCRKNSKPIPLHIALEFLEDDRELIETLNRSPHGFKRSLPPPAVLQNVELAAFMRQAVANNGSQDDPKKNPMLDVCYTRGWLHAQLSADRQVVYVFPTTIHHRYLYLLFVAFFFFS